MHSTPSSRDYVVPGAVRVFYLCPAVWSRPPGYLRSMFLRA